MGHKAAETTSTMLSAQELLMNIQSSMVQEVLQRRREPWRWGESWPAVGRQQWPVERIVKAGDPYSYTLSCRRTQRQPFCSLSAFEANWKGEKTRKCVPHELTANKKEIIVLKYCLLLFCATTTNHFLIRLWCVTTSGFYTTTSNDQLSGWSKKKLPSTSQSQTCTNKRSWSLFSGLLLIWSSTVFWILAKPLHQRSMLSKLMRCTKNGNVCSHLWSTERAQFFSGTTLTIPRTTNGSKI